MWIAIGCLLFRDGWRYEEVTRDGGIGGVVEVVDGSRSFYVLILIGK